MKSDSKIKHEKQVNTRDASIDQTEEKICVICQSPESSHFFQYRLRHC